MFDSIKKSNPNAIWDDNTLWLYIAIVFVTYVLSYLSGKMRGKTIVSRVSYTTRVNSNGKLLLLVSGAVFLFFMMFRDVGADLQSYRYIFDHADKTHLTSTTLEPGFVLANRILHHIFPNSFYAIAFWSIITIFFVFKTIYNNSSVINVGLAVLAFACLYYFQTFNLIRIYLSASVMLYGSKWLINGHLKNYALLIAAMCFIHYSTFLLFLPLGLYYIYIHKNKLFYPVLIAIFFLSTVLLARLSTFMVVERYAGYIEQGAQDTNIGLLHYVINLPIIALYFFAKRFIPKNNYLYLLWVLVISSLLIGLLSYKIVMLGRALVYMNVLFIILIPYVIQQLKLRGVFLTHAISFFYIIYLVFRLHLYFKEYLQLDQIMPYEFISL